MVVKNFLTFLNLIKMKTTNQIFRSNNKKLLYKIMSKEEGIMDAKELRIGNYVLDIHNNITKVESICSYGINLRGGDGNGVYADDEIEFTKPIPLTEEWFSKFNLNKLEEHYVSERFKFMYKKGYNYWYVIDRLSLTYLNEIEFVHEFQNFMFVMDGKELTIKP